MFRYNELVRVKVNPNTCFSGEVGVTIEDSDDRGWVTVYLPGSELFEDRFTDFRVDELELVR